jgi:hypothetical protein
MSIKGMELGNILLTHGHAISIVGKNIEKIITGHLHPILIKEGNILNGQRVWIRIILRKAETNSKKYNEGNNQRVIIKERKIEFIIIPHFNNYLNYYSRFHFGTRNKKKDKTKLPMLNNLITKKGWDIDQVFIISLDGSIIGSENDLKKIL